MMGAQQLDDVLRAGTAVKNIAENMKLIDRQPFDQIRESGDKGVRRPTSTMVEKIRR